MNNLAEEIEENLDDIEYYLSEFYECNKIFEEKTNEINLDKTKNTFQKVALKTKLAFEHKMKEKHFDGILGDFKDVKKSKLLFFMGSTQEFVPINKDKDEDYQIILRTYDFYYLADVDHIEKHLRPTKFGIEKERVKLENEIDVHSDFDFINIFNNKIHKEDLKNYVNDMIEKYNFQTWEELRVAIIQDLAENKDILNERENFSSREEYISNQNTNSSNEQDFFSY